MKKSITQYIIMLLMVGSLSGCAMYSANLKDTSNVYHKTPIANAKKIIVSDFKDMRKNKKKVAQISALGMSAKTPIPEILADRIATKLNEQGLNVGKINVEDITNTENITKVLHENNGQLYITGKLVHFFVKSFDAVMQKAKGTSKFQVSVYDPKGEVVYQKDFVATADKWIGATGHFGTTKLIEETVNASVDEIFDDPEFQKNVL